MLVVGREVKMGAAFNPGAAISASSAVQPAASGDSNPYFVGPPPTDPAAYAAWLAQGQANERAAGGFGPTSSTPAPSSPTFPVLPVLAGVAALFAWAVYAGAHS